MSLMTQLARSTSTGVNMYHVVSSAQSLLQSKYDSRAHALDEGLEYDAFFLPQTFIFCQQSIFYCLFLNEGCRIGTDRLSNVHYRFRRYTSFIKTV